MAGDDLRSLPGLQDNHRRALASKLGITSLRALADADQRAIHTALANFRPRPKLALIAAWQDEARSSLGDAAIDPSAWHTAASFAVIFAQRQTGDGWERRLEAEQTEVEPPAESRQWPGWKCGPLCDWMLSQLDVYEDQPDPTAGEGGQPAADVEAGQPAAVVELPAGAAKPGAAVVEPLAGAAKPAAGAVSAGGARARLRIDSATITDAGDSVDLIRAGKVITAPPHDLSPPVRLRLTVGGARSGQQLRAAVWFRRQASPGWSPHEPAHVPPSGQAEFDLSSVPHGEHNVRLLAWATGSGATLAAVTLPRLTFLQEAREEGSPAAAEVLCGATS